MDTAAFREAYNRLNEEQRKAVDSIEGPVMVVAGPGTGKTTILTLRIANILRQTDTPPSGILAITYTDAGVKAMRTKLAAIVGSAAHDVHIHTFHGFAAAMIREYPDHFLHLVDLRQITDIEQESLIREILIDPRFADLRPMGKPDAYVGAIRDAMSAARRDARSPDDIREYAAAEAVRIENDEASISTRGASKGMLKAEAAARIEKCKKTELFADVYAVYEQQKRDRGFMDFDDLIIEFLRALQHDELFRRLLQERYLYIHVDEHQDTNDAQNLIVRLIAEFFDNPNVFIVGDEKQAIYRFQGASVENFLALKAAWPSMMTVSLSTNYRSHQSLLDASFSMIEQNYDGDEHRELRIPLAAGNDETPRPVDVVVGENVAAAEAYLIESVRDLREHEPQATIAVITRRNRELERVLSALEGAGISVSSERSIDIFAHPMGRCFFDLIEYLADPTRIEALARTMIAGCWGLSITDAAALIGALRSGTATDLESRLPGLQRIHAARIGDALTFLVTACRESGYAALAARNPANAQVWRGIMALAESVVRDQRITDPADLMRALLAYRQSAETKTVKVSVGAPDSAVVAMTAHGSKGLEFDYVFLPYATEEAWVGRARGASFVLPERGASGNDIRDLRRLFYVALTRARRHAILLTAREESDGKALTPLRFIDEIDPTHTASITLPRVDISPETVAAVAVDRGAAEARAITDLAKRKLTTSGLSVTALNHFLEDPQKFLLESILQLPQAPSASAEKGSAMHAAMDRVWKSTDRNPSRIETLITETVDEYLSASLLAIGEKEAVRRELHGNAPAVAAALVDHFRAEGTVSSERWIEAEFTGGFGNAQVAIPIHGKLDALVERDGVIDVFDYKTRKGMTPRAIRGETKSGNGNYFRQLAFYTLLLSSNIHTSGNEVRASLVFLTPDKKGACPIVSLPVREEDLAQLRTEIQSLIDFVWGGKLGALAVSN